MKDNLSENILQKKKFESISQKTLNPQIPN